MKQEEILSLAMKGILWEKDNLAYMVKKGDISAITKDKELDLLMKQLAFLTAIEIGENKKNKNF